MSIRSAVVVRSLVAAFAFISLVGTLGGCVNSAAAATLGYWRFENSPGFLLDSSGNGNTLSVTGTVTQATLPGAGPGSAFPTVVPNNSLANTRTADIAGTSDSLQRAAISSMPTTEFTIETFVNWRTSANNNESFADGLFALRNATQLAAFFQIRTDGAVDSNSVTSNANGELWMSVNNGTTGWGYASGFAPTQGKDYYMAAAFKAGSPLKFYVKNLTDNTALQTFTVNTAFTGILNASAPTIEIGGYANASANFDLDGLMDEIRLSNVALDVADLLINAPVVPPVPEPATVWMLSLGMIALRACSRRSHSSK